MKNPTELISCGSSIMHGFYVNHPERQSHEKIMQHMELGAIAAISIASIAGILFILGIGLAGGA